jgi:hypothetical protein
MAEEEAPPPNETLDKTVRVAREGCGCLSYAAVILVVLSLFFGFLM